MPSVCRVLLIVACLACSFILSLNAAEKWVLSLGGVASLDECGLRFNVFKELDSRPLRPLETIVLTDKQMQKSDAYRPRALWFYDQCVGYWSGENGSIFVGRLTLNSPNGKELPNPVKKEAFEEWKENAKLQEWGPQEIKAWLLSFAEMAERNNRTDKENREEKLVLEVLEPEEIKTPLGTMAIHRYKIKEGRFKEAYLLSNPKDSSQRMLILYMLEDMADKEKCKKAIMQSVESANFFPPKPALSSTKKPAAAPLKHPKRASWSDDYAASREKVIDSLEGLKGWSYSETDNYIYLSDAKQKARVNEIQVAMEKLFGAYKSVFPPLAPIDAIKVLRIFESHDEFLTYIGKEKDAKDMGAWLGSKREYAYSLEAWTQAGKRVEDMHNNLAYIGFQQYFFCSNGGQWGGNWFRDGNSFFFRNLDFRGGSGGRVEIGLSEYWLGEYKKIGGMSDIAKLVRQPDKDFYDKERRHENQTRVWALIYYLYKGAPLMKGKSAHVEIPGKYYKALVETKNNEKATDAAFAGIDMGELRRSIEEFYASNSLLAKSKGYQVKPIVEPLPSAKTPAP